MSNGIPAIDSIWFGSELRKFKVVNCENGVVFYRPFINAFKNGSPEYSTTVEAFKYRFSPFVPKKPNL